MNTPWGMADSICVIAEGIRQIGTPRHGGIWLSAERQKQLPEGIELHNWLKSTQWYEEDCDWVIPFLLFASEFQQYYQREWQEGWEENHATAHRIAQRHKPAFYQWYTQQQETQP